MGFCSEGGRDEAVDTELDSAKTHLALLTTCFAFYDWILTTVDDPMQDVVDLTYTVLMRLTDVDEH